MKRPLVYIVILNYNNSSDTIECLESIKKLNYENYNVILVDNCSTDKSFQELNHYIDNSILFWDDENVNDINTRTSSKEQNQDDHELFSRRCTKLTFIRANSNKGYATGNNIGLKWALNDNKCEYVWILNNDTCVDADSLKSLVYDFEAKINCGTKLGLLGSKLIFYYKPDTVQCIAGKYRYFFGFPKQIGLDSNINDLIELDEKEIDYVSGASVFTSRQFLLDVGFMNEEYFLYFEELDWAYRGKELNYTMGFCQESIVYHKDGASTKIDTRDTLSSPFSDFHFSRSKVIFNKRFFKSRMAMIYISFFIVMANRLRKGQFKNIAAILRAIT